MLVFTQILNFTSKTTQFITVASSYFAATEPKQVIRSLRPRTTCLPSTNKPQSSPKPFDRSTVEESSSWKLPPNVYRFKDYFIESGKKQTGKLGPYQCFTVERDMRTVISHFAMGPLDEIWDVFYDLPTLKDEMLKASNRNKAKFLKGERFGRVDWLNGPKASKYYPQNFVMKPDNRIKTHVVKRPLFYYPQTTVPVKEMLSHKDNFFRPMPGRYNPHDVTCKCYLNKDSKRCPGDVKGHGHSYVFDSVVFRLVRPFKIDRRRTISAPPENDATIRFSRAPRDPISFRLKRSISTDNLAQSQDDRIRYNTIVKKRKLFSVKTGRPVAFGTASPRFKEKSEVTIKIEKEKPKMMLALEEPEKVKRKPMTKERLEELATPKMPLAKITAKKTEVLEKLPQMPTGNLVKRTSIPKFGLSRMSEISLRQQTVES